MSILLEALTALLMVGLPIAAFTLALVWWAMSNGHLQATEDSKSLKAQVKAMAKVKAKAAANGRKQSLLQKKWAKFGGGFYGIVAFFTYLVIEVREIISMVVNLGGFIGFIKHFDVGAIISIFIEAFINFIAAMIWPVYWMSHIDTNETWLWFVAAYAGYWLGLRGAQQLKHRPMK